MTTRLATDRQTAFIQSLVRQVMAAEQQVDPDNGPEAALVTDEHYSTILGDPNLTVATASKTIEDLKARLAYLKAKGAVAAVREERKPVAPGFYIKDGTVYRVVPNRAKTRTYAKRLDFTTGRWHYAGGVVGTLTEADTLTETQAAAMGHRYGICVCCGAELTDPESVARGIGPVCLKHVRGR